MYRFRLANRGIPAFVGLAALVLWTGVALGQGKGGGGGGRGGGGARGGGGGARPAGGGARPAGGGVRPVGAMGGSVRAAPAIAPGVRSGPGFGAQVKLRAAELGGPRGGFGGGGFYPGWYGAGLGYYYGGDYSPREYDSTYYFGPEPASYGYTPSAAGPLAYGPPEAPAPPPAAEDPNTVVIAVRVPAEAELWFDGEKTSQSGTFREFVSPPLSPEQTYAYQIRARWTEDGQVIDKAHQINVHAGRHVLVDFLSPVPRGRAPTMPKVP